MSARRSGWLLLLGLALPAMAQGEAATFPPVTTPVGDAVVDWTRMVIRASAEARPFGVSGGDPMMVEDEARSRLGPMVLQAAGAVRVDGKRRTRDIIASGSRLGNHLDARTSLSWNVVETRYHTSGRAEVDGELDLQSWLQPLARDMAASAPHKGGSSSAYTGVVVDARDIGAGPALAPRLLGPDGAVLYSVGMVAPATTRKVTPVQYVTDPADPLGVRRAGERPLLLEAVGLEDGVDLVLTPHDAARLATVEPTDPMFLEARVVLVLGSKRRSR